MHRGLAKKLQEFLEQEKKASINEELLEQLWAFTAMPTMYWQFPPEERNTLNKFFRGLVDDMIENMTTGSYGASVVLESTIVAAFEAGIRYDQEINLPPKEP